MAGPRPVAILVWACGYAWPLAPGTRASRPCETIRRCWCSWRTWKLVWVTSAARSSQVCGDTGGRTGHLPGLNLHLNGSWPADLMTEMTDLTSDLEASRIPFLDYRTYAERAFFPGHVGCPLQPGLEGPGEEGHSVTVCQGLTQLSNLLNSKLFLLTVRAAWMVGTGRAGESKLVGRWGWGLARPR